MTASILSYIHKRSHTCMHASPALLAQTAGLSLGSGKCVGLADALALTSDCRAGRRSSQGDTHCLGLASPSRKLGSACCRQRSFLWCQKACQGKGMEDSRACQGATSTQGPAPSLAHGIAGEPIPQTTARLSLKNWHLTSQEAVLAHTIPLHPFHVSTRLPQGWPVSKGSRPSLA